MAKSEKRNYRLPTDLISSLSGEKISEKLSDTMSKFPKNMREKLVSDDTLYEHYGKKEKTHISVRMTLDEANEIDRLHKMYKKSHTKIVTILATASLYSENELKKLIKKMGG